MEKSGMEEGPNPGKSTLTEGSIRRGIWILAWPAVLTMSLQSINNLVDTFFIGRLNDPAAIAAVGLANNIGWVIMTLMSSVNVGTTALVARFTGARSGKEVHETVVQSMFLAAAGSALIMMIIFSLMRPLIGTMSDDPAVRTLAVNYLTITILTIFPFFLYLTATSIFRGVGNTIVPLIVILATTVIKIGGDYILIFGTGPIPHLGIRGAAMATAGSQILGMILGGIFLLKSPIGHALHGNWRPQMEWMKRILRIGSPAAVQNLLRSVGSWVFFAILGHTAHATDAQAALAIGLQLESLAYMPGFGFNIAAATLVGQNLGAKKIDRAEKSAWGSARLGALLMGSIALGFFILARPLAALFTSDPQVQEFAVLYLRINAVSEPFFALTMVLLGAFEGAGDTVPPTFITLFSLWAFRIPLAYFLAVQFNYGAVGAWIAMSGSVILQGILITLLFQRGSWKRKKV